LISDPEGGTTERAGRRSQKLSAEQTPQEGAKAGKVWKVDPPLTGIDKRIADYKPDRSLADPAKTADLEQYLKNARYVPYSNTPFFKEVNELQGTPDPDKVDVADYIHARASLFNNQDVEDVPLDKVVVTQPKVNKDRVQEIIDKPETDEVTPILAVRYKG